MIFLLKTIGIIIAGVTALTILGVAVGLALDWLIDFLIP